MNIIKDVHYELMCSLNKFPFGIRCFNETRTQKLTYRQYFQRLLDVDGRFARDLDCLFAAQYIVEASDNLTMLLVLLSVSLQHVMLNLARK